MATLDAIRAQIKSTTEVFATEEMYDMVKTVADLTAAYYHQLVESGIPAETAALITAQYSAHIGESAT